jgi:hypothetical protein
MLSSPILIMDNLADYLLDILQNSIQAEAKLIHLSMTWDKMLHISIEDNGKGMSEEILDQVTSPFYTTRKTRKVGLGLSLLKMLTEQTEGTFHITSKPGVGTSLTLAFDTSSIDMPPIGNLGECIYLMMMHQDVKEFIFQATSNQQSITFKRSTIYDMFHETLHDHQVMKALIEYMNQEIKNIRGVR